jgi:hypothetical protein
MKRHGGSQRRQSEKTICMIPTTRHCGKSKTLKIRKKLMVFRE